jgi:multidrug resistance efflux pump
MNRSLVIVMIVLLIGTGVGAYWVMNGAGNPFAKGNGKDKGVPHEPAPPPMVVAVGLVDGERTVTKPLPLVQGRVIEVAAEGTAVQKGDAILKIDDAIYKAVVAEATAALHDAQERHKQAKDLPQQYKLKREQQQEAITAAEAERKSVKLEQDNELTKAKTADIKVNQTLLDALTERLKQLDSKVKAEQLKLEELKLFKPESEIKRAEADGAAKQAQLDKANWGLEQCTLKAPSEGLILRVTVSPGEVIVAGLPGQAPPIQFLPKGPKVVRAEVLQEWAGMVLVGQEVDIEDDVFQGPVWKGRVKSLSHWFAEKRHRIIEPFMLNDVRTLECLIEVTDESPPLRIGQRVRVKIKTK